ncbi:ABC transporter permease [Kaistia sp. 32K]|uniref:ABC transporter permease n=1 Tax=Kaistia sp. 32K TaxID=2795690 RepID=UPI0019156E6E|nr:ABC transporter permease [Kaistia sp. 32K]BCP52150.1 ABC transporter permease [Kaistia sp. 32K]
MKARLAETVLRHSLIVILVGLVVFFAVKAPAFPTPSNLLTIVESSAILLIVALAMTLIIASGGIDLSVGVAVDFGAAFALIALKDYGAPWYVAILAALAGAALVGAFNALLIVGLGIKPFLATLGTFFIGSSIQRIYTDGGGPIAFRRMEPAFRDLATGDVAGIPTEIVIAGLVLVAYYLLLERTIFGERVHAIGLQPRAARVAGIRVGRHVAVVFIIAAASSALGGVILAATLRQFTPLAGQSYLLDAIAATFIGASIHPRLRPNVPGTLIGVLFLGVVANGLNLLGLDFNLKSALSGLILVGALALAGLRRRPA